MVFALIVPKNYIQTFIKVSRNNRVSIAAINHD